MKFLLISIVLCSLFMIGLGFCTAYDAVDPTTWKVINPYTMAYAVVATLIGILSLFFAWISIEHCERHP